MYVNATPILFALAGLGILVWEIMAYIQFQRALRTGSLSGLWRNRRRIAWVTGLALGVLSLWSQYPLAGGTVAGIPFFAAWFDARGRDYVGVNTLPALVGNMAFWFLLPQLVVARLARKP